MTLEEKILTRQATGEEIYEFRNSFNPDEMGYSDESRDLSIYEDSANVEFVSAGNYGEEIDIGNGLTIKKFLSPYNFTDKNNESRIEWIVIHYFGGLGTAFSVANYFNGGYRGASAHYALDENPIIWQVVEDGDISWHCGDGGIGAYKNLCKNSNSVGIEVRPHKIDASRAYYASDKDWYFDEQTTENLRVFVKYLMTKYNIPADHVIRHYDVTQKICPSPWVGDHVNTYYNAVANYKWQEFKNSLEEDDMDVNKFTELYAEMVARLIDVDESDWSDKEGWWDKATEKKIVNGKSPKAPITREEFITVCGRLGLIN